MQRVARRRRHAAAALSLRLLASMLRALLPIIIRPRDLRDIRPWASREALDGSLASEGWTEMTSASEELRIPRSAVGVVAGFAMLSCGLLALGRRDYAQVHTILDTSMTLMSGVLMLVLLDLGTRTGSAFATQLALAFAATFLLELVHV